MNELLLVLIITSSLLTHSLAFQSTTTKSTTQSTSRGRSHLQKTFTLLSSSSSASSTTTSLACICINCSRVTNCKAYHFVESKHSQPHMNPSPTFLPRDGSPTIHVNIRTVRSADEMTRMWAEHSEETRLAEEKQSMTQDGRLMGENKYDVGVKTTYEYDVVACADYDEDMGAWVRNMPEEIRKANPNFVPT